MSEIKTYTNDYVLTDDPGLMDSSLGSLEQHSPSTAIKHDTVRDFFEVLSLSGLCLLYTSDAADERSSVDLGGRRIIKKKTKTKHKKKNKNNIETA